MSTRNKYNKIFKKGIDDFNDTKRCYPNNIPIYKLLESCAGKFPHHKTLFYEDKKISYLQLNNLSNKIAHLLLSNRVDKEEVIAVLMNRTPEMVGSIFAILKVGAAYLPIDPNWPKNRIMGIINNAKVRKIIVGREFVGTAEDLLWESNCLNMYICADSDARLEFNLGDHGKKQAELWNYVARDKNNDLIGGSGWINSYNNKKFSRHEIDELINNVYLKLKLYLSNNKNVLDIGCGTGLVLEKVAPYVNNYHAVDISKNAIELARENIGAKGFKNIKLEVLDSDGIKYLSKKKYDIIIINSIVQFFPNFYYLNNFLKQVFKLLRNDGVLFIGDIRDRDKQIGFYESLAKGKSDKNFVSSKLNTEQELFIPKSYFSDFCRHNNKDFEITKKIGKIKNELLLYRYDVILRQSNKILNKTSENCDAIKRRFYKNDINEQKWQNPNKKVGGHNLAYVIYTSGSTGKPKGVMIEHHSVINRITWMQREYKIGHKDIILQKTPFTFDVSVWELFLWLVNGSKLVLLPQGLEKDIPDIIKTIKRYKITVMHFVPSVFNIFLNYIETSKSNADDLKSLKQIFFSGEVLYRNQILRFIKSTKSLKIKLHNLYGPTEATVDVTYFYCNNNLDFETVPIGLPIDNTYIYLLDENKNPVDMGKKGEIYISGVGVARGYLNNRELTRKKFIKDPFKPGNMMYVTGDVAKRLPDGNVLYLDRMDNQIKIGGVRIELGEISKNIVETLNVEQCYVRVYNIDNDKILVAYYISRKPYDPTVIKNKLADVLPGYMIPNHFVHLTKIPLNTSGKVDYSLLPRLDLKGGKSSIDNLSSTEEKIADLYKNILKISSINGINNFFELGGASLMAMELIYRINSIFNIELSIKSFFENSKISDVAKTVEQLVASKNIRTHRKITKTGHKENYRLSDAQRRLWFLYKIDKASSLYNVLQVTKVTGNLNIDILEKAIRKVADRHSILRSSFLEINGEPHQRINNDIKIKLGKVNFSKVTNKPNRLVEKEINKFSKKPFILESDVLFRAKLIILSDKRYLLCLCLHHIVCDGWSMYILNNEISKAYKNIKNNTETGEEELKLQFVDYAEWTHQPQYNKQIDEQEKYWLSELHEVSQSITLPLDNSGGSKNDYFNVVRASIDNKSFKAIKEFCRNNDSTYYMFLLACFYVYLCRMTGSDDITIGMPIANRQYEELKNLIGFFSNTLAIRVNIENKDSFLNLLEKVKDKLLHAYDNQSYPFDMLVKKINPIRNSEINPIFNVMFTYFDKNRDLLQLEGANTDIYYNETEESKFDLTTSVIESSDDFVVEMKYKNIFNGKDVKKFLDRFILLVSNILKNTNNNIYEIDILTSFEYKKLLNNHGLIKKTDNDVKLYDYIEKSANLFPKKAAIKCGNASISYSEFNKLTNQFASFLRKKGVNRNVPVGLLMNKSIDLYIAIYSILKAGGAYVPIDPELPNSRIKDIIHEAKLKYIILNKNHDDILSNNNIEKIYINDDQTISEIKNKNTSNIKKVNKSSDLAYVIYTSGSTGMPKGVMCSHKGVANTILTAADIFKISQNSRILQIGNITFDTSVLDMNLAFYLGATLISASKDEIRDPFLLRQILVKNRVTFGLLIPTTLYHLSIKNTYLKCLASGSESISSSLVNKILRKVKFFNTYGPTEFSIFCTYWPGEIRRDKYIPIGKPTYNTFIYILDKFLRPVPMGVVGEIFLSGLSLSLGYLNNKDRTKKSFINNPFIHGAKMYKTGDLGKMLPDGNIVFIGRTDNQVKIRGFRIELGDIESNLISYNEIRECAAKIQTYNGEEIIVAYYISNSDIEEMELKKYLKDKLPVYMLPRRFIRLEEMPHNINGKVDRKKLPQITDQKLINKNDKKLIDKIINVWRKVLSINEIKPNSNFFDLGGHSILVLKALFYLKSYYEICLTPKDFYNNPTPELIAEIILSSKDAMTKRRVIIKKDLPSPAAIPKSFTKCHFSNVMVTGGTGFVGAYIINELLKNTKLEKIFVLVKADNIMDAKKEIDKNLNFYFKNINLSKIIPIPGDLTKRNVGIDPNNKIDVLKKVDLIIHAAADVSHVGNYEKYHNTNVLGTKNLLNFIREKDNVRFCYISTLSISGSYIPGIKKYVVRESDLEFGQKFESYYDQSKFEAEKLTRQYIANGLDGVIFRLGNVVGASDKYFFQKNKETNAFYNYLRSIINTHSNWGINFDLNFTPVDIVANILVYLAFIEEASGQTFHIFNDNIINSSELVDIMNELGCSILKEDKNIHGKNDKYFPYLNNYLGDRKTKYVYDNTLFNGYTHNLKFKWPCINRVIIKKIINNIN